MVFQNYALFPHLNVRQNIGFGLKMRGTPKAEIERKVDEALAPRAPAGPGAQAAGPALRRPAAARRHRPRHRHRAAAGADGRAAVQPRRQAAAGDARGDPAHPQRARRHDDLRDARSGRGAVARRPHRRAAGRRRCGRSARRRSSTRRRPISTWRTSWASATSCKGGSLASENGHAVRRCRRRADQRARPRDALTVGGPAVRGRSGPTIWWSAEPGADTL